MNIREYQELEEKQPIEKIYEKEKPIVMKTNLK